MQYYDSDFNAEDVPKNQPSIKVILSSLLLLYWKHWGKIYREECLSEGQILHPNTHMCQRNPLDIIPHSIHMKDFGFRRPMVYVMENSM